MPEPRPLGIDLGTTYSAVATITDQGRSVMCPNSDGQILTPSVVFFEDEGVMVGNEAKKMALENADAAAICPKRDMGKKYYSKPIRGAQLPPEVIQACILKRLKDDAVAIHGGEMAVVITVPAYFDEPRRRATSHAGEMAGLNVLDIVNEPTAAALAYGEQLGYLDEKTGATLKPLRILVYDLGGGTFDVTLLDLKPGDIHTLATDGDVKLGGRDWDEALANYGADCFYQAHGSDPRDDPQAWSNTIQNAEQVKQALTFQKHAVFEVRHGGHSQAVPVTLETFEELTEALVERTSYTCRQLLQTAKVDWNSVDRIILVGGSTRMPMISRMLTALAGKPPERGVHPDEAVARGAAIYALHLLHKKGKGDTFKVTNVNAHSLGIEGFDTRTSRSQNVIIIPRNTTLPAKRVDKFVTKKENQASIAVRVLEGESREPTHCSMIGKAIVRDLPKLPQGWPIQVTYEYRENGRLMVSAVVPGTDQSVEIELENAQGLSKDKVRRWRTVLDTTKARTFSDFEDTLVDLLNEDDDDPQPKKTAKPNAPIPVKKAAPTETTAKPGQSAAGEKPSPRPTPAKPAAPAGKTAAQAMFEKRQAAAKENTQKLIATAVGFVVTAVLGLLIGYYIVAWVTPMGNALDLPLPGLPDKPAAKTPHVEKS
ncbi:MAG: Hsp70 family protein [Pirellulales bacterium]